MDQTLAENEQNKIDQKGAILQADAYLQTYITALDLCLQGTISPSTLGIDTKKLDNAEAQREKEKATLYTRDDIIESLQAMLPQLIYTLINSHNIVNNKPLSEVKSEITFGEYANPSFEAIVETLSNPNTPMSIDAKVEEMWGDNRDDVWKKEEVKRLKDEMGMFDAEMPFVAEELDVDNKENEGEE